MKKTFSLSLLLTATILLSGAMSTANASALDDPGSRVAPGGPAGSGGLVPVNADMDAGDVTIGATGQVVMRFRNEGGKDIKISQIDLYPSSTVSTSVSLDECSKTPLGAGAECAVVVTVKGVKTGNWRVEALVRHDGRSRISTAVMKGSVQDSESSSSDKVTVSDVETIPNEIDFGSLTTGRPLVKSVVLRNVTSESLEITKITASPSSSGYSVSSTCTKLVAGEACAVTVTWAPSAKGISDGVLMVEHTGGTKVITVDMKGDFQPETVEAAGIFPQSVAGMGLMISSQEELDFGTVSNEASITTSLVNVGDTDLKISDIELGGVENGLRVSKNGCRSGTVLRPVEACPMTLTWAAVREGSIIDDVQIHHDGARGVLVLPVRGNASAAVNRDTKAVIVESSSNREVYTAKPADKSQALEGFIITSLSKGKAIINGPGGSRVVNKNQQIVLGGIQWVVDITGEGVDFVSGRDRVRLLFDRSLSSVNRTTPQSTGSSSSSSGSGSTTSSTSSTPSQTPSSSSATRTN